MDLLDSADHIPTARSIEVFYSYAHEDEAFVRELEKQLHPPAHRRDHEPGIQH